jgi:hypothetical protein
MLAQWTLAAAIALAQVPATGDIEGVVRGYLQQPDQPLPFAVVEVRGAGILRRTVADSLGQYRIAGLPAGPFVLTVTHPGHQFSPIEVVVAADRTVLVDVDLVRSPVPVRPLEVVTEADPAIEVSDPTEDSVLLPDMSLLALEGTPGLGEVGLGEAAAALPGNDPADPSDVLFMRGSTTDLKLVLLDGAPVYTPFHLGGLLQSFDAAALGGATLHVGGAPARYDGGLAYILDLRTRRPRTDRLRGRGSVDLISAQVAMEGPIGARTGFAISGRALHDAAARAFGDPEGPYGYGDVLARLETDLAPGHRMTLSGFWNRESVLLDLDGVREGEGVLSPHPEDASWGNGSASLAYRADLGRATLDVTGAASAYRADLPLQPSSDDADPFIASARTRRYRLAADGSLPMESGRLRLGALVEHVDSRYEARLFDDSEIAGEAGSSQGELAGIYVDAVRRVAPEVDLRLGLRADAFSTEDGLRMAPRVALLWSVGPEAMLTVAAGRYHQYTRAEDPGGELAISGDASGGVSGPGLSVATSDHVVLSLDQRWTSGMRLGLAGFWKSFRGLGEAGGAPLHSSGLDVRVRRSGTRGTAWLGYNLTWFWSASDVLGTTSEFSGRQLLSSGLRGSLRNGLGADLRLAYSAGLPYTSIPFGRTSSDDGGAGPDQGTGGGDFEQQDPPLPGAPDDGFLRLDLEVFGRLRPVIGGRELDLKLYLRVLNALEQRDALFYYFQPWRDDELRPLADRSLLPVLGLEWRF